MSFFSILLAVNCSKVPSAESDIVESDKTDSLTQAKNKEIQDFWTAYRQATKNRFAGSWQEAIDGYTAALEINNLHEDAIYYLGNMHLELSEYNKAEEKFNSGGGGKVIPPGIYDLKIVEAEHAYKDGSCMSAKDPSWLKVKITLEDTQERQKSKWILVPTTPKITYNEGDSKAPLFVFFKFKEFMQVSERL